MPNNRSGSLLQDQYWGALSEHAGGEVAWGIENVLLESGQLGLMSSWSIKHLLALGPAQALCRTLGHKDRRSKALVSESCLVWKAGRSWRPLTQHGEDKSGVEAGKDS